MDRVSDSDLITRLQAGSLDALGLLYDRHRKMVFRTALAITGDVDAAGDLLQDVFLRLHRFACHIDTRRPLEPWLYRMTANLAYTWVKRHHRWPRSLEEVAEWLGGSKKNTPPEVTEVDEESRQIQQAVSALPLPQRIVVVLYYINDLSIQEISGVLEVPVGTVKSRLHYGRLALKDNLGMLQGKTHSEMRYEVT